MNRWRRVLTVAVASVAVGAGLWALRPNPSRLSDAELIARVSAHPGDAAVSLELARRMERIGNTAEALVDYGRSAKAGGGAEAWAGQARMALVVGDIALARESATRAAEYRDTDALRSAGETLFALDDLEAASRALVRATATGDPGAYDALARVRIRRGDFAGAVEAAQSAVDRSPRTVGFHVTLASALRQGGRLAEAREAIEGALAVSPNDPHAWFEAGTTAVAAASSRADRDRAIQILTRALAASTDPRQQAAIHYAIGQAFLAQKQYREAEDSLRKCRQIRPDDDDAAFALGRALSLAGKTSEGEALLRETAANKERALMLRNLKNRILRDPTNASLYLRLGDLFRSQGDTASARAAYTRCLELSPENRDARTRLIALER